MKLLTVVLFFSLAPSYALTLQLPFRKPSKHGPSTHTSHQAAPFTAPWVAQLQLIYNTRGKARDDTSCPTAIQSWSCEPYELTEKDWVKPTDVWHLRPHVSLRLQVVPLISIIPTHSLTKHAVL